MVGRVDVARRAGVSPAVVSYVMNGSHPVSSATRARVRAAIEELGYRPNALARGLALSRTHTLGLLLPDSSNPYFAELSSAIEDAAFRVGYTVLLGNGGDDEQRERTYAHTFIDRQVDGVIVCQGSRISHDFDELVTAGLPVIATDRSNRSSQLPAVVVDNASGAAAATAHLIEHGRRVIGCVTGRDDLAPAADRAAGWRAALAEAGMPAPDELIARVEFTVEDGRAATHELLSRRPDIDALFVASDLQALGALRAAADAGRRAGDDIAIIGFDGIRLGDYTSPRLTTVAQPFAEMADTVVSRLLAIIDDPDGSASRERITVLNTALVVRESCGCDPASAI